MAVLSKLEEAYVAGLEKSLLHWKAKAEAAEAELPELRRKAWHWDEARAIVQQAADRKAILFGALDPWGGDLIGLILGEDAEWERKATAK